jgi:hypothetical protein
MTMTRKLLLTIVALLAATPAIAQSPGWEQTGGWTCKGGLVRVITSNDGFGSVDFEVRGAWFDNHYTLRGDMLFYNGELCVPFGLPFWQNFSPPK